MRASFLLSALLCLSSTASVQAAWGFGGSKDVKAPTRVVPIPPAPAAAPFEELVGDTFPDVVPASETNAPGLPHFKGRLYEMGPLRIYLEHYVTEAYLIVAILLYTIASLLGTRKNEKDAEGWFIANETTIEEEFAAFGMGEGSIYVKDSRDEFLSYATGRRAIESLSITIKTKPRHDIGTQLYYLIRTLSDFTYKTDHDKVVLDFKLLPPKATAGAKFCWAVCDRSMLRSIRDQHWSLNTFTNTAEVPGLSNKYIVMTESGDVSSALLKSPDVGLIEALQPGAPGVEFFESLVISDMPSEKPNEEIQAFQENDYHLILTLKLPPTGKSEKSKSFIGLACNIADVIHSKSSLIPNVACTKLTRKRQEVLAELQKPLKAQLREAEIEEKESLLAQKQKLEKERENAKIKNMSKEERLRYLEKNKKAEEKKLMTKMAKKQQRK